MLVARLDGPCGEADLAALLASGGLAEVRKIRADLLRHPLGELVPEPGEGGVAVDDKPNPFGNPMAADAYLRDAGPASPVVPLVIPPPDPWQQHAAYTTARAFRVAGQLGTAACPRLVVLGRGDGLGPAERARTVDACLRGRRPCAVIQPVDGITRFLAVDSEDRCASVAIVAFSFQHVAVAVATGSAVAVGTHHAALIRRGGGPWILARDLPVRPVLASSVAAPAAIPGPGGRLFPEWGNQILLNGVLLGGVEAAYQPQCWPCDGAASYIAAAAGRTVARAVTGRCLSHPHEVQALLISALRRGGRIPGLVVARHELAARRLLKQLRRYGIALTLTFGKETDHETCQHRSPERPDLRTVRGGRRRVHRSPPGRARTAVCARDAVPHPGARVRRDRHSLALLPA
jgi:hypothetical protein